MNRKILVGAVAAGMLAVPASQAAIDDAGMQYTSAAEGFYGSLRMEFSSTENETKGSRDADSSGLGGAFSRLGVRGSVDLGGGLGASYRYEFGVNDANGGALHTRLHTVGLDGNFGSILVGAQWALDYNTVWGSTDVMNNRSGNFAYSDDRAGRQSNAITYTSPDFNGFNFGISAVLDAESRGELDSVTVTTDNEIVIDPIHATDATLTAIRRDVIAQGIATANAEYGSADEEGAAIDKIVLAASFATHGFNIGGTYVRRDTTSASAVVECETFSNLGAISNAAYNCSTTATPAIVTITEADTNPTSLGLALGYGQDNWSLNYWYGQTDSDTASSKEEDVHSVAGQLQVGKTTLRALYETSTTEEDEQKDIEVDAYTLSAQYDLGSKSRVWFEYAGGETENGNASDSDNSAVAVGYRVDF